MGGHKSRRITARIDKICGADIKAGTVGRGQRAVHDTKKMPGISPFFCSNSWSQLYMKIPLQLSISTKPFRVHSDCSEGLQSETTTLKKFFLDHREKFQDETRFPLSPANHDVSEGGCQFAFNRVEDAPMRCLECWEAEAYCKCERPRICLQDMKSTDFVILDIDRTPPPGENKYSLPSPTDVERIQHFEDYLKSNSTIAFFYRTKCSGLRIGVRSEQPLLNSDDYRAHAEQYIADLSPYAPGGGLSGAHLLYPDDAASKNSAFFHVYPRRNSPIWINPNQL